MLQLLRDPASPIKNEHTFIVLFASSLSFLFHGRQPEEIVAALFASTAVLLFTIDFFVFRRRRNLFCYLIRLSGVGFLGFSYWALVSLKLPSVDQDQENYGVLPIAGLGDLPILPPIGNSISCSKEWFKDSYGRVVMLRGVNLGGDSKIPALPNSPTYKRENFYNHKNVTFVGRPFPLDEADEHLGKLRSWGFTFLRLIITWEAIEHGGPGEYDTEYLVYLREVVKKCEEHGISVFIDPHQDVWSRWTGGDGAPGWTLEKVGFDLRGLFESGAALTHQEFGDPLPRMVWPTNYNRLATATMFTLFFAGDTFAPNTYIEGVPVQQYLQQHYFNAIKQVALMVRNLTNVVGYDTLNEPSPGYSGLESLNSAIFAAPLGAFMSVFQGMQLGAGSSLQIPVFDNPFILSRMDNMNPNGRLAWKSHAHDIWRNEGVWTLNRTNGEARILRQDHFAFNSEGKKVEFFRDFMAPFFEKFKDAIHDVHQGAIIFAEPSINPNRPAIGPAPESLSGEKYAWAPHYYDAVTLLLKKMRPWVVLDIDKELPAFGTKTAQGVIEANLLNVKNSARSLGGKDGGAPVLVGEIGIPMDLDRDESGTAHAYQTGDFSAQILALNRLMNGLEGNLMSFTLWTYSVTNSNKRGDQWNDEDFSLWSKNQQVVPMSWDINSGGRALQAAVRPYPMKTCGIPLRLSFDPLHDIRHFSFTYVSEGSDCDNATDAPTIIYVPHYQYPNGIKVEISDGQFFYDKKNQHIIYSHDSRSSRPEHKIDISSK